MQTRRTFNPPTSPSISCRNSTTAHAAECATRRSVTELYAGGRSRLRPRGWLAPLPRSQFNFASGPVLDADGRSCEAECLANLVFEKPFVREMQLHVFVREKNKGGWRDRRLRHIEDFDFLAMGHSGAIKVHLLDETVHLSGGNALAPFRFD